MSSGSHSLSLTFEPTTSPEGSKIISEISSTPPSVPYPSVPSYSPVVAFHFNPYSIVVVFSASARTLLVHLLAGGSDPSFPSSSKG